MTDETQEVEAPITTVVIPYSGEVISLDDVGRAAQGVNELRAMKARIEGAIRHLSQGVGEYSRIYGSKTIRLPDTPVIKVSGGPGTGDIVWDLTILSELREAGLPEVRWDQLVEVVIERKVHAKVAAELEKSSEVYAEIIARARSRGDKSWSVST